VAASWVRQRPGAPHRHQVVNDHVHFIGVNWIGVNWPHRAFLNQDFKVVGAE
jgi:hypothetical protein